MPLIDPQPPLKTIFESLEGKWQMRRSLDSRLPGFPSGTFAGEATFTPHNAFNGNSYLYHETGELQTEQGFKLRADMKYIYRLDLENEKISAWFVKDDNGKDDVDYLYHELEFERKDARWIARGDHLCVMDMYWTFYDFRTEIKDGKSSLSYWGLRTQVKGPEKDYTTDTAYHR
ncbi:hypothetical protein MBLNU457_7323t1 [Dothideomycetes sp. NU457]